MAQTRFATRVVPLSLAVGAVAVVTLVYLGAGIDNPTVVALTYLLVVLVVAALSKLWTALTASLLAFLCFNFFFLPPVGTYTIDRPEDLAALFALLAVSLVASHLSSQAQRRAREATARREELTRLLDLTRDILLMTDPKDAVSLLARSIAGRFDLDRVTIYTPTDRGWVAHGSHEAEPAVEVDGLDRILLAQATEPYRDDRWWGPLRVGIRPIGVLVLEGCRVGWSTRDAIAGVTAIAIERTRLLEEHKEAEVVRRSGELKSALLASLSHDLKTPLTAIAIGLNNLKDPALAEHQRGEQMDIVLSELERLSRLFQNLVEMARIETRAVAPEAEWVQPSELVEAAAAQAEYALARHRLEIDLAAEDDLVRLDPRLTSAALAHVLENAAQYSPAGSAIGVTVEVLPAELRITVRDEGPGIADDDLERLFDRSYRGSAARRHAFGTGMGLAITRGLVEAQGGNVRAESRPAGGARFTITVPASSRRAGLVEAEAL